jgi:hypothetical protein
MVMAVTVVVYSALVGPTVPGGRFAYDEADYMYAVSRGFAANYFDRPTIPFWTFVQKGLNEGMKSSGRTSLSEYIRSSNDIAFYRHFHAPLYYYWVLLHSTVVGNSERAIRWASFDCVLLGYIAMYLGCLALAKQRPRTTAILTSALFLFSPASIATTRLITPHGLYVVTVIIALFAMAKLIDTGNVRYWYYSLAAVTLALLTIEYAVLLVATLAFCGVIRRRDLFMGRDRAQLAAFAGRSILLVLAIVAVAWPAGLFKLTLAKNYIFFTYFAVVRGSSFGTSSAASVWFNRIAAYPVEFGLLVVGVLIGVGLLARRRLDAWLLPFAAYGFLMMLTTLLNRSPDLTYISSLAAVLVVITGTALVSALAGLRPVVGTIVSATILTVVALLGFSNVRRASSSIDLSDVVVDLLARNDTARARVAIPGVFLPTVHYYFPNVTPIVYPQTARCSGIHDLAASTPLDGVICRGSGQDSLQRQLEQQYDVSVDRLGSADQGRELVFYRLSKPNPR